MLELRRHRYVAKVEDHTSYKINKGMFGSFKMGQRFTGNGKTYTGINWFPYSEDVDDDDTYQIGIMGNSNGMPDGSFITSSSNVTFGTTNGWVSLTLREPFTGTDGTVYHMVVQPDQGDWGGRLPKGCYANLMKNNTEHFVPFGETADANYVALNYDHLSDNWDTSLVGDFSIYLASSGGGYGLPYHSRDSMKVDSSNYARNSGIMFWGLTGEYLSTVNWFFAAGSPGQSRTLELREFTGTGTSYPSESLIWSHTCYPTTGDIWRTFSIDGFYGATSTGNFTLLVTADGTDGGYGTRIWYYQGHTAAPLFLIDTVDAYSVITDNDFSPEIYSKQPIPIELYFQVEGLTFDAYVYEWSHSAAAVNIEVKEYEDDVLEETKYTDSDGKVSFTDIDPSTDIKIVPSKYQWEFSPVTYNDNLTSNDSATFILGPDTIWPNDASPWAFRKPIIFDTPHPKIPKGQQIKYPLFTGYSERMCTNADFNEGIGSIDYGFGKTHVAWRAIGGEYWGNTKDHATGNWGEQFKISNYHNITDTHYYPVIRVDNDNYIHIIYSTHGGYLYYYKFATAGSMDCTKVDTAYLDGQTYAKILFTKNNTLYNFGRFSAGPSYYGYNKKDINGNWKEGVDVAYLPNYEGHGGSIYSSGVNIDKNDVIHLTLNSNDGYTASNSSGSIYYLYSPPSTYGDTTEPGHYWYAADGWTVAILTYDTTDLMTMRDSDSKHALVATSYAWDDPTTFHGISYHSNVDSLSLHPTLTYESNSTTLPRPYLTFHQWDTSDVYEETAMFTEPVAWCAWYDPNASDKNEFDWVCRNITTALVTNDYVSSVRPWKGRHWGNAIIDDNGVVHVYGFIKKGIYTDSAWWAGELAEWYSEDDGITWDYKQLTDRSSVGIGQIDIKRKYTNNMIELTYCRGNYIEYYAGDVDYAKVRSDGADVMTMYTGRDTANILLDCVSDFWNFSTSKVYLALETSIPEDWAYDTAGMHYIYYGRTLASPKAANVENIFGFYENFEGYDILTEPGDSGFRWSTSRPRLNENSNSDWRIISSYYGSRWDWTSHTNKLYSGDRSLEYYKNETGGLSTSYLFTALPTGYQDNIRADMSMRSVYSGGMFGIQCVDTVLVSGFRYGANWNYYDGEQWHIPDVEGPYAPKMDMWARCGFEIINNSITFFFEDSALNSPISLPAPASKILFGWGDQGGGRTGRIYFDYLILSKVFADE